MNKLTTCPGCGTTFFVSPEQLDAYQGDVRCGKCNLVFNALANLAEIPSSAPPATEELNENTGINNASDFVQPPDNESATTAEPFVAETEITETVVSAAIAAIPEQTEPVVGDDIANPEIADDSETLTVSMPSCAPPPVMIEVEKPERQPSANSNENSAEPKFVLLEPAPKPVAAKAALLVAILLLAFVSLGQTTYFLRSRIAADFPTVKPWLIEGCRFFACSVELPKHVDLLAIDDSDLQQDNDHDNVVTLSTTIINHAAFTLAYPYLEITLTDEDNRPLLRRLFKPDEYLEHNIQIDSGLAASAEIAVKLHLSTGDLKPSGYRVYLLYP